MANHRTVEGRKLYKTDLHQYTGDFDGNTFIFKPILGRYSKKAIFWRGFSANADNAIYEEANTLKMLVSKINNRIKK